MSYARFGWEGSDVYLIGTVYDGGVHVIECCGCIFTPMTSKPPPDAADKNSPNWLPGVTSWYAEAFPAFTTNEEALAHLDRHRAAGHTVPESAYTEIRDDDWVMGHG